LTRNRFPCETFCEQLLRHCGELSLWCVQVQSEPSPWYESTAWGEDSSKDLFYFTSSHSYALLGTFYWGDVYISTETDRVQSHAAFFDRFRIVWQRDFRLEVISAKPNQPQAIGANRRRS